MNPDPEIIAMYTNKIIQSEGYDRLRYETEFINYLNEFPLWIRFQVAYLTPEFFKLLETCMRYIPYMNTHEYSQILTDQY